MEKNKQIRYQRQLILEDWGEDGQKKLEEATVFVAGAGGLGAPVIYYLAAAGIGHLRICDADVVELSNLNRQILYTKNEISHSKVNSAINRVAQLNENVNLISLHNKIDEGTVEELVANANVIIDCLDNYKSRLVLNKFAVEKSIPLVHAGVQGMYGQVTFIHTPETPCLSCLLPEQISELSPKPIVGATAGVIGSMQALEVLKYIVGIGKVLKNRMLIWDGEEALWNTVPICRKDDCLVCS